MSAGRDTRPDSDVIAVPVRGAAIRVAGRTTTAIMLPSSRHPDVRFAPMVGCGARLHE